MSARRAVLALAVAALALAGCTSNPDRSRAPEPVYDPPVPRSAQPVPTVSELPTGNSDQPGATIDVAHYCLAPGLRAFISDRKGRRVFSVTNVPRDTSRWGCP